MIGLADEVIRARRKQTIRWAAGIFMGCLLLLTFFSNTYQQMTIPKVSVEKPQISQLSYEIEGEGTIRPKRTVSLYDQSGWEVKEVLVNEGDTVKKGQQLIVFDSSSAAKNLADEQDRFAKQQLDLEKLQDALKLNGIGGEASKLEDSKRQIASLKLDMSIQARKIASIQKDISDKGSLAAPFDGLISDLQADEGLSASQGKAVVQISDLSQGWELETSVDADSANRIVTGETIDVRIKETEPRNVKGKVSAIEKADSGGNQTQSGNTSNMKQVTLDIDDPKLTGGEQAEFQLTKKVGMPRLMVPKSAVKTDSQGEYIFTIQESKSPLGNEFRVVKKYVHTEDSDETNAVLKGTIMPDDKIVTESSEPISDGDLVRLN
ncbi:efflux RND transporter periplasmic adaptor subunit [Paenibacillus sedimenti]|uniref:Efflux RND transporter periplasmic adaptor subunit n=1 Tax=Paenibacillus sedimenti TaxID=2770274 RepID=A0A926KLF0_9BACL|nr:efflux RND transporter periplasmic adaptor subunit [Paenibacillus sedimenti]MBD0379954.1 efflux RND transporter periplasmic adaptor subunit [Paenibacillus sedimenti]